MEFINNKGNSEKQKSIVNNFFGTIQQRPLLEDDLDMLRNVVVDLAKLECSAYRIKIEFEEIENDLVGKSEEEIREECLTIGFASEAENIENDSCIGFDIRYFYEVFFKSPDVVKRKTGLMEMLGSLYHEIEHSKQNAFVKHSRLRPQTLEIAREMIIKTLDSDTFYDMNYDRLTSEAYAEFWGKFNATELMENIEEREILEKAKAVNDVDNAIKLAGSKIGKIYKSGKFNSRDSFFIKMSDLYVRRYPDSLYNYPILQKVYNKNGTPKGLDKLFEQMIEDGRSIVSKYYSLDKTINTALLLEQEYIECTAFYFEAICPLISNAKTKEIRKIADKFGVENVQSFLAKMKQYFSEKAEDRAEYSKFICEIEDKKVLYDNEEQIKVELMKKIEGIDRFSNECALAKESNARRTRGETSEKWQR